MYVRLLAPLPANGIWGVRTCEIGHVSHINLWMCCWQRCALEDTIGQNYGSTSIHFAAVSSKLSRKGGEGTVVFSAHLTTNLTNSSAGFLAVFYMIYMHVEQHNLRPNLPLLPCTNLFKISRRAFLRCN